MQRERLEEMSRELQISIEIDTTGWLREWIQVRFALGPDRTIHPTSVRISNDPANEDRLRTVDILGRCDRYNRILSQLRILKERCTAIVERGHAAVESASLLMAFQSLQNLEADIERHQVNRMGNNVFGLSVLDEESGFFEQRLSDLEPIVQQAEAAELQGMFDAETLDKALEA